MLFRLDFTRGLEVVSCGKKIIREIRPSLGDLSPHCFPQLIGAFLFGLTKISMVFGVGESQSIEIDSPWLYRGYFEAKLLTVSAQGSDPIFEYL